MTLALASPASSSARELLERDRRRHEAAARAAAQQGDVAESARQILALLDCERRLSRTGPQVLQVIKPRRSPAPLEHGLRS